jgi:transposase-like protein
VQTVAAALEIHAFMLSKWRKDAKGGRLRGRPRKAPLPGPAREIAQLQALERRAILDANKDAGPAPVIRP